VKQHPLERIKQQDVLRTTSPV